MLPGDVIGTQIYNPRDGNYTIKKGPVFGNFVLADEINRAPAKVQSALLEAMQERQVTLGDQTLRLPDPFLVHGDPEPDRAGGHLPAPEAQLDRFMLKVRVGYPTRDDEVRFVDRMAGSGAEPMASKVFTTDEVLGARDVVKQIFVDDQLKRYAVDLVAVTRDPKSAGLPQLVPLIDNGASVRASIALIKVSKAQALLSGRTYVSPHDIKTIALDVLRHRVPCVRGRGAGQDERSRDRPDPRNVPVPSAFEDCCPPRSRRPSSASSSSPDVRCPT